MEEPVVLARCGIVTSRLFTRKYVFLIIVIDLLMFFIGIFTHFQFETITVGTGVVIILLGTYLIGRQDTEIMELQSSSFDIKKINKATTYSYNSILGIVKDNSAKPIDFRYRMITSESQYLLDTSQKDLPDSVINRIGFWVVDQNFGKDMVCWKRLVTDQVTLNKSFIEVLTWSDRLYFKQFQTTFFVVLAILGYFALTMMKFLLI